MKHISRAIIALMLSIIMAAVLPVQVFADSPDYVSEIKVAAGDNAEEDLKGYTILKSGNKIVDINQNAGGGTFSKGEKRVIIGYKTTKNRKEAVTDLALMNMKGGYSVAEYEALMETQMKSQIIPFATDFISAIKEYRENYNSKNKKNKQRAHYIHDILNKLTDDDTGKTLGDLFLNETKFEMGDEAYDALPEEEKKNHADILTIIAQANGKATLLIKNLLTRASDTEDDTWIERFADLTYEDLIEETHMTPSAARKALAKAFDDDANVILSMWETFREQLLNTDEDADKLENAEITDADEINQKFEKIDENSSVEEMSDAIGSAIEAQEKIAEMNDSISNIAVATFLQTIEYGEGTLYDFFTKKTEEIEDDITVLYPLVASLSHGQRAGLEFVSLREFVIISDTSQDYDDEELDKLEAASIYEGVDRGIYHKGGVAITSDALRTEALLNEENSDWSPLGIVTAVFLGLSAVSCTGFVVTLSTNKALKLIDSIRLSQYNKAFKAATTRLNDAKKASDTALQNYEILKKQLEEGIKEDVTQAVVDSAYKTYETAVKEQVEASVGYAKPFNPMNINSEAVKYFTIGFSVAMFVFSAVTLYLSYEGMKAAYNVDFTPIPHYMIDEKDLIGYNSKGEKVVLKNQSAYYKAVECNRKESDEHYKSLGTCADLNGDVGSQWLALYAAKNENEEPILADSFEVVVDSEKVPGEYETGIHMFGSASAFNLNSSLYDWNDKAPSVFIYYKTNESKPNGVGANFTAGIIALAGGLGIVFGGAVTAFAVKSRKKKNK